LSQQVLWVIFFLLIFSLLFVDLGLFQKRSKPIQMKEALFWSGFWIFLSLAFNGFIYIQRGPQAALDFFTGYLIEKSLSIDNIFVFALIFAYFKVPEKYQHKVLYHGIIGAFVMRIVLILAGIALLQQFHWIKYLLAVFLCLSGIELLTKKEKELHPERNILLRLCRRYFPMTEDYVGSAFFVRKNKMLYVTPLLAVLLMVESADLIFALDSIPAIFAITTDPFIVYTSNIFAILGLRSLYFVLAELIRKSRHLKMGLSLILIFIGIKMLISSFYVIPTMGALLVVLAILIFFVLI
jgi:tellurite resistance protein TerC